MIIIKEKVVKLIPLLGLLFFSLILLAVSRFLLFTFNKTLFDITTSEAFRFFFLGLRFDFSASCYANLLFILLFFLPLSFENKIYKTLLFLSFIIPNSLFIAINLIDSIYYRFTFNRSSWEIFSFVSSIKEEMKTLSLQFIKDFWPILLLFIAFVFLLKILWKKIFINQIVVLTNTKKSIYLYVLSILLLPFILIIGARGGFQKKPISILTAGLYVENRNTPLVLNSAFSVIRTYGNKKLEFHDFFENKTEMLTYFNVHKNYHKSEIDFKKKNIVLIILESFSNEHLNSVNKQTISDKNFAPFLDSLIHEGIYFSNTFANAKRSVEGIPAIISSLPSLLHTPFILSQYANIESHSLANLLKQENYYSAFFHGGHNGTMNLDYFAASVGFDDYFGKNEFNNNKYYDNKWGIWDEHFLQFTAEKINTFQQNFFACIFTLSSHHPYKVPKEFENILPDGSLPIHKTIAYADYSLKRFFETAEKSDWYKNTIFVICSDHSSEPYLDFYKSQTGRYSIPFLIFEPSANNKKIINKTTQQTDILPTILDYINFPHPFSAFGNSALSNKDNGFSISFSNDQYQIIIDSLTANIQNHKIAGLYNFKTDFFQKNNLVENPAYQDKLNNILKIYQSFVQQYNYHLNNNSLTKDAN